VAVPLLLLMLMLPLLLHLCLRYGYPIQYLWVLLLLLLLPFAKSVQLLPAGRLPVGHFLQAAQPRRLVLVC
jgi:hypothetical protein